MKFLLLRKTVICLAVSLPVTSVALADMIPVAGSDVTLLSNPNNRVYDSTAGGAGVIGATQISTGALGRFDPTLGVLTSAVATSTINPAVGFIKGGGSGPAYAYSAWSLGGNNSGNTTINAAANNTYDFTWSPITLFSTADNLNNFVGDGNIATNSFSSNLTVSKTGGTTNAYAHSGTSLTQRRDLIANESIAYTYSTHSNAAFASGVDVNDLTIDFGELAFGTSANENFSIFNLGGLGLTNYTVSFLDGDDLFNITGGSIAAGGTNLFNAYFAGQSPLALTDYDGTYRLTFTDDVSSLSQYASSSIGTNYIDLRMMASIAPADASPGPVPEPTTMLLFGAGIAGLAAVGRRKRS